MIVNRSTSTNLPGESKSRRGARPGTARHGICSADSGRLVPESYRTRHGREDEGDHEGHWLIGQELGPYVQFQTVNLMQPPPQDRPMFACIFLRNLQFSPLGAAGHTHA